MRKYTIYILVTLLLLLFIIPSASYSNKPIRTIVAFFPLNANLPAYQNFLEGYKSVLSEESDEPYNLLIEYLDLARFPDEDYMRRLISLYNEKLRDIKIDLLVIIPPFTYSLLEQYGFEALEKTPTIKLELDPPFTNSEPSIPNRNTVEVKMKCRVTETLEHAFKLFPGNKHVYIISGNTITDTYFASLFHKSADEFKADHSFTFISGISLDSTVQVARKIPVNSIVFVPIYLSDKKNIPFSTPEAIEIIANNCNAPVFPMFDSFIKTKGGIGGFVLSYTEVGKETGRISREIINGVPPARIKVNEGRFYQDIYDWNQVKKWNLVGTGAIPANSTFYNKEYDFIHEYRWQLFILLLVLISETLLIVYLFKLNKRQKETARHKEETESVYRELIREDRLSTMVELTASLSHELNQPLTAILYSAQAGNRFLETEHLNPGQAREIFNNIIEDDKRAAELISSVRSLMKLETREKEKVNLTTLIADTVAIFNSESVKQHIRIIQHLLQNPVFVFGDKIQLQQVVLNFLSNAAIAMENTDAEQRIIEITERIEKGLVRVSVRDSGPGIDDSIKEKLFKPFITSRKSGFGIGLAVSRSIIEKHNGEIRAENASGGGAEFSFRLKVFKDEY
jgi:signal transduction histidine kinase